MRIFFFILAGLLVSTAAVAQSSIVLESAQLKKGDTCIFYGYVMGKLTKGDTILAKTSGRVELNSREPLNQGQYILQTPKQIHNGIIEFLIEKNKNTALTISHDTVYDAILFKDDPINGVYSAYLGSVRSTESQVQKYFNKAMSAGVSPAEKEAIGNEIKEQQKKLYDQELSIIKRYPNTLLSAIVACNNLPSVPGSILDNYRADPTSVTYKQTTKFLRENYWSGVDFSSDILLNTSFLAVKVKKYIAFFDKKDPQVIAVIKELLGKSSVNSSFYQLVSDALYTYYSQAEDKNDNEKVLIFILENAMEQSFVPDWKKESIKQQILIYQKNSVGSRAANLTLKDTSDAEYRLNNIKSKYTILYFYDPECSNCAAITPKIKGWYYIDGPKDATVLAIYINQDEQEWNKYIKDNTYPPRWINVWDKNESDKMREKYWIENLPAIYVLDENKNVLLKNANFKQLISYFSK
jgi:hypothetical protein